MLVAVRRNEALVNRAHCSVSVRVRDSDGAAKHDIWMASRFGLLRAAVVAFDAVQLAAKHVAKEWRGAQYVIQRGKGPWPTLPCLGSKEDGDNGCREDAEIQSWLMSCWSRC